MEIESLMMKVFFQFAWKRKPKFCQCGCGELLPIEINTACMDHLLEKAVYPECKYSIKNIFFVTSYCHQRRSGGFPSELHQQALTKAKENYEVLCEESRKFEEKLNNIINQYG